MKKLTNWFFQPKEVTDEKKSKSRLGSTAVVPKSKPLVQGVKSKNIKSPTNELRTKRKLPSQTNELLTERKPARLANELSLERKSMSLRNELSAERKLKSVTNELSAERKLKSVTNELSAERKRKNVTNEQSAERKLKSLTNELSAERKPKSLTNELSTGRELTFVCISDTHCKLNKDDVRHIPHGDVLLHTGDFTMNGNERELLEFNNFLGALPHTYKVVIAGNHEFCLEDGGDCDRRFMKQHYRDKYGVQQIRDLLTNCIYLQDELTAICGIKIYGSPWTPMYSSCDAFSLPDRETLQQKWDKIPDNVDILMTHAPPRGFGDTTTKGVSAGCSNLVKTVQNRVKPKYHVFGHIHEGYGVYKDGKTTFINASICTRGYKPTNRPVKFRLKVAKLSACDIESANSKSRRNCESFKNSCDNRSCDTLEFVNCENGCDTSECVNCDNGCDTSEFAECANGCDAMEFINCDNGCDTSEFVKCDNGCDTSEFAECANGCDTSEFLDCDNDCDTSEFLDCDTGCDSELTKINAPSYSCNTKPEQFNTKLRDCASNWNWAENDGTDLNYSKLTAHETNI